jgi:hypothetical protein
MAETKADQKVVDDLIERLKKCEEMCLDGSSSGDDEDSMEDAEEEDRDKINEMIGTNTGQSF